MIEYGKYRGLTPSTLEDFQIAQYQENSSMTQEQLEKHALLLLRESPEYLADARAGARVGNSVVGSLLSIQLQAPRQYAEQAVLAAVNILDSSAAQSLEADGGGNFTLRRSGQPPLRFQGELIASADGQRRNGCKQDRWHELAVYRTQGGKYVVKIAYRTRWPGENDHEAAKVVDDARSVGTALSTYDPVEFVAGFPASDAYAGKQARLLQDLRLRYDALVSEVTADEDFAETIA